MKNDLKIVKKMSKFSKRINDVLKFTNENQESILDFLDETPVLYRSIQACIEIRKENIFEFNEHLSSVDAFHIFNYIMLKIHSIFRKFFDYKESLHYEDLYQLRSQYRNEEITEEYVKQKLKENNNELMIDHYFQLIKEEQYEHEYEYYFDLDKYKDLTGIDILMEELNKQIKEFLSNFKNKTHFTIDQFETSTNQFEIRVLFRWINDPIIFLIEDKFLKDKEIEEDDNNIVWKIDNNYIEKIVYCKANKKYMIYLRNLNDYQYSDLRSRIFYLCDNFKLIDNTVIFTFSNYKSFNSIMYFVLKL